MSSDPAGCRVTTPIDGRRAVLLFALLVLLTDLLLIAIHLYASARGNTTREFYVDADRSFGEFVQYLKFVWLAVLVAVAAWTRSAWQLATWVPLFLYFLLDDALLIHERVGHWLAVEFGLGPAFGLRPADFGEHLVSAAVGLVVLVPLAVGYLRADAVIRREFHLFAAVVAVLLFFALVVDSAHVIVIDDPQVGDWMGFVEDAGEMLATSALVVAVYLAALSAYAGGDGTPPRGRGPAS